MQVKRGGRESVETHLHKAFIYGQMRARLVEKKAPARLQLANIVIACVFILLFNDNCGT